MKMKDKQAGQIAKKKAHKASLKVGKMRRAEPDFQLPEPTRLERQRFLIVCEGKNTEPGYFNHLRRHYRFTAAEVITVGGAGETIRVVQRAQEESQRSEYDQIWVVFDKDDFPADHFDNAVKMAEAAGFGVVYSNQAFEYWLILHFEDHQGGALHRSDYGQKINNYLNPFNISYDAEGSKSIAPDFFRVLMDIEQRSGESRLDLAIKRAERILTFHADKPSFAAAESSTTVFRLVQALKDFA